jgi:hypothetical protein
LQLDQEEHPSRLPLHLPLPSLTPSPSPCPVALGHKEWGGARGNLAKIALHLSLSPPATLYPQSASSHRPDEP